MSGAFHPRSAVVVLPARLGPVLPATAVGALRAAAVVYADPSVLADVATAAGAEPSPSPDELAGRAATEPVVLLTADPQTAAAVALDGVDVVTAPPPAGAALLDAAAAMDRLRSPGGCPWDAEQTHDSLRPFLIEETYELLEAIEHGDRAAIREELGDVLLQVLFHARMAEEHPAEPFSVDEVAAGLAAKLIRRHPHVFGGEREMYDPELAWQRWDELKAAEKPRSSVVDGVAFGQPSLALVAKLVRRAVRAGVLDRAMPAGDTIAERIFTLAAEAALAGTDPELAVRAVAKQMATGPLADAPAPGAAKH